MSNNQCGPPRCRMWLQVHTLPIPARHVLLCALAAVAGLCRANAAPPKVHHI